MIVADTNLAVHLLLGGEKTSTARRVDARDPDWAAPWVWRSEFRGVLAVHLAGGRFSVEDALAVMREAEVLFAGAEFRVRAESVLRLCAASGCSAYDCEFAALVTSDVALLRAFPRMATSPEPFARR